MVTLNQSRFSILKKNSNFRRRKFHKRSRSRKLRGAPFKKGVCTRVTTMKPKKPNSAVRKIAKVRFSNGANAICYIAGFGHTLREYSQVLVRGGHVPDLPGVQYHLVRGKFDFSYGQKKVRVNRRSLYGVPKTDS